jgi:hypothetical protein
VLLRRTRGSAMASVVGLLGSMALVGIQGTGPAAAQGISLQPVTTALQPVTTAAGRLLSSATSAGSQLGLPAIGTTSAQPAAATASGPFIAPVAVSGATVGEPGINVAPDGSIYINGPAGFPSASPVFKSTDGGSTWALTPSSLRSSLPGGEDSNVAVDPTTGTLYMVDLWLASSTTSRSTDGAQSWVANPLGVPIQDRPWVATAGNGDVYMVTHQIPLGLVVSKSVAPLDGVVFPVSTVAATPLDQQGCICPPGNIIAEPGVAGDQVGVIYSTSTGAVHFAFSKNGGLTFTNSVITGDNPSASTLDALPVVADAGNGHLVAAWLEDFTASNVSSGDRVQISTSSDFGTTWAAPRTLVSSTGGTSVYPWVATSGSKVSVSLYHTTAAPQGTPGPDTVPASAQWFESYMESSDGGATFPSSPATIDLTAVKTGPICTQGPACSANRQLLDFQTVTIDPLGRANVSYARATSATAVQTMFDRQS